MQEIVGSSCFFSLKKVHSIPEDIFRMNFPACRDRENVKKRIAAFAAGDGNALQILGLGPSLEQQVTRIMNTYSSGLPGPAIDILAACLASSAPERATLRLEGFFGSGGDLSGVSPYSPEFPRVLATIFSTSGPLSLRIAGDRSIAEILSGLPDLYSPQVAEEYYREIYRKLESDCRSSSEKVRAVHRMQTVQFIRICARNSDPSTDISEIGRELSALADAVIGICLEIAVDDLAARFGTADPGHTLSILGLGKLGGRELNVSSDIDLIYLYRDHNGAELDDRIVYHTSLAERLTRLLTEPTELGALYRVDTRLRADGASGPLVRSMRDYFRYLEMRGEAWERQMLLKSRPVTGDLEAAGEFLRSLDHFIFPSTITRSPNREIAALKNQIEARFIAEGSKKTHLKLMPGGIRDIEFIVQCLQLLMGGIHHEVRTACTRDALDRLRDSRALSLHEHSILTSAYALYRRVENALQWRELLPAFSLPESEAEMSEIARNLGYDTESANPGELLRGDLNRMLHDVRAIFEDVFSLGKEGAFPEMSIQAVLGTSGDDMARRFLENLGFPDPAESARCLSRLVSGDVTSGDTVLHPSVERFIPLLLGALSDLPDPSGALERLSRIVEAYNARHMLFDMLNANPKIFELLISITHNSIFLTDILVRDPSLLDWLVDIGEIRKPPEPGEILSELRRIDRESATNDSFSRLCRAIKNREKLRVGARNISGLTTTLEAFTELSSIAECMVKAACERAFAQSAMRGKHNYAFSVIAAGRLGSGMMDFGSDLDLIFVYRGDDEGSAETATQSVRFAQTILSLLTGGGGAYKIYDVDARLRPEGGNSVLAVSLPEYRRYLEIRASVWERLAMVRAREVAGNTRLGAEVEEMLRDFAYRGKLTGAEIRRIMDIRARMTESSGKRHPGLVNVKSGAGGLADIDFIAQTYAAHYGAELPGLRHRETLTLLDSLSAERIIERDEAAALSEAYRFLCDTEKSLRIGSGRSVNTVPRSGIELARAARLLGFRNVRKFTKRLQDVITLTRERYERLMFRILHSCADAPEQE